MGLGEALALGDGLSDGEGVATGVEIAVGAGVAVNVATVGVGVADGAVRAAAGLQPAMPMAATAVPMMIVSFMAAPIQRQHRMTVTRQSCAMRGLEPSPCKEKGCSEPRFALLLL